MGFILAFIANVLFSLIYLIDGFIILLTNVVGKKWYRTTSIRSRDKAFKTDIISNWLFPTTWNLLFSNGGYSFGRFGESLSSCLGRKKQENTLSWVGLIFYYILYAIDYTNWEKGGHCIASIMTDAQIKNFIK